MTAEYGHLLRQKKSLWLKIIIKAYDIKNFYLSYGLKFNLVILLNYQDRRNMLLLSATSAGEILSRIHQFTL